MKIKVVLASILSLFWGYFMASQFGLVKAGGPIPPVTYPISYPISYPTPTPTRTPFPTIIPIPSIKPTLTPRPVPKYSVSGKVSYRIQFWRNSFLVPASGVVMNFTNKETGEKYSTKTDWNGNYAIYYLKVGKYTVTPNPLVRWFKFSPSSRDVLVTDKSVNGIDFVGYPVFLDYGVN